VHRGFGPTVYNYKNFNFPGMLSVRFETKRIKSTLYETYCIQNDWTRSYIKKKHKYVHWILISPSIHLFVSTDPALNEPGQFSCHNLKDLPVMSWINSINSVGFQYVRPPPHHGCTSSRALPWLRTYAGRHLVHWHSALVEYLSGFVCSVGYC